jgi:hypothetical protein
MSRRKEIRIQKKERKKLSLTIIIFSLKLVKWEVPKEF